MGIPLITKPGKVVFLFFCISLALINASCTAGKPVQATKKIPVILDTDIGDDMDDAWALALLLQSQELDVKLILTDNGKPEYRSKVVAKFLDIAGRTDIPIGMGIDKKSTNHRRMTPWIKDFDIETYPGKIHKDGVQQMIDLIMNSPEPITLLCIGPLPNLAEALRRQPEIGSKVKLVGMYGSIRKGLFGKPKPFATWNIKVDIPSAQAVFKAKWPMTITPVDTCGQIILKDERYRKISESTRALPKAIMENYKIWCATKPKKANAFETASSTLFDTLSVFLCFRQDFCTMEELGIRVDEKGFTRIDPNAKKMSVATEWKDIEAFKDLMVDRLVAKSESEKEK
jgi:inosine-uridine nucleoside N-ribohydrolase